MYLREGIICSRVHQMSLTKSPEPRFPRLMSITTITNLVIQLTSCQTAPTVLCRAPSFVYSPSCSVHIFMVCFPSIAYNGTHGDKHNANTLTDGCSCRVCRKNGRGVHRLSGLLFLEKKNLILKGCFQMNKKYSSMHINIRTQDDPCWIRAKAYTVQHPDFHSGQPDDYGKLTSRA